jgi:head-tail adaptor
MAAAFSCDEQVSIERLVAEQEPVYGTSTEQWVVLHDHFWANVQDVLPGSDVERTTNGLTTGFTQSRLRVRGADGVDSTMRVVLHGRGDKRMQIIRGPARLNDRVHDEFLLEEYGHQ